MIHFFKLVLWKQFGGSIDMLKNAIELCPDELWTINKKFYYSVYHCLVFLDYYVTVPPQAFKAGLSYTLIDPDQVPPDAVDDVMPDEWYTREAMLAYLQQTRQKAKALVYALTEEQLQTSWIDDPDKANLDLASYDARTYSVLEILLHNMRHVQHHTAQLNLLLRRAIGKAPDYVSHAKDELSVD